MDELRQLDDREGQRLLRALRRRLPLILLCAVLVPAAALAVSLQQEKQYEANATLLFRESQLDQALGERSPPVSGDAERQAATNVKLVSLDVLAARTAERLPGLTSSDVSSSVVVSADGTSDVVSIAATGSTPGLAARLANTFAQEYIRFRR